MYIWGHVITLPKISKFTCNLPRIGETCRPDKLSLRTRGLLDAPWRMPLVLLTDLWASLSLLENQLVTRFQTGGQFTFQAEVKKAHLTSVFDSFRGCLPCLPCAYHLLPGWVVISGDTYSVRLRRPHRFRSDTFTWLAPDILYITVHCDINSD